MASLRREQGGQENQDSAWTPQVSATCSGGDVLSPKQSRKSRQLEQQGLA